MPKCVKPYRTSDGSSAFTAKQLARQNKNIRLDVMRTWFLENYCDPVHCCPYDSSSDGFDGYIYLWGGPYDANDILFDEFINEASEQLINILSDELFSQSSGWSPIPKDEKEFEDYLSKEIAFKDIYDAFTYSIKNIDALMNIKIDNNLKQFLYRLVYANIITALETYLSDTFIKLVTKNGPFQLHYRLRKMLKKNNLKHKKIKLSETWSEVSNENDKKELSHLPWHNLKNTENLYKEVVGVTFAGYLSKFDVPMQNRHDIVHRNGKNLKGILLNLTKKEIKQLSSTAIKFVTLLKVRIDKKLDNSDDNKIDEAFVDRDIDF